MPADPVRELELSIKKEREDEIAARIKSEPRFDIPEKKRRNPNQTFKCRLCPAEFKSKYAFTVHFNKEMISNIFCLIFGPSRPFIQWIDPLEDPNALYTLSHFGQRGTTHNAMT